MRKKIVAQRRIFDQAIHQFEIAKQLRGEAGKRQVPDADIGLTHNVGGIGQYCFVQVLKRD